MEPTNMRASGYARVAADWYIEPASTVNALLDAEPFTGRSWDPSCGAGNIPRTMQARGLDCWGSDVADRGFGTTGLDFFAATDRADNIVSNPPYGMIEPYVLKALAVTTGKVALLARLALLEGIRRRALFASTPLARVWVSSRRISMPPGGIEVEAKGGAIAYAWFVWDHQHRGAPSLGWI
jgi:hypothetical protein